MNSSKEKINKVVEYLKNEKYANAEKVALSVIKKNPNNSIIWGILGGIYLMNKNYPKAIEACKKYIEILPDDPEGYNNLGYIFLNQENFDEAAICYKKMINLDPHQAKGYYNLGMLFEKQKDLDNAINYFKKAISINPKYIEVYINLALVLKNSGKILEANEEIDKALLIDQNNIEALNNLGNILLLQGKIDEAVDVVKKGLKIDPKSISLHNNKNYYLNFSNLYTKDFIFNEHIEFDKQFGNLNQKLNFSNIKKKIGKDKINIGYVSGDFKQHSVSFFFQPLLENHDREKFNIYCYSNNKFSDNITLKIKSLSKKWTEIFDKPDNEVFDIILNDKIDILVDLSGHTRGNRLIVFAKKPAPIQITWLGYPNTTGLSSIDYRFTDMITDPIGQTEKYYSENLYRLPNNFLCFTGEEETEFIREIPFVRNKYITFGSFNNFSKITDETIKTWSSILNIIPNSRLVLKTSRDNLEFNRYIKLFSNEGVEKKRIDYINRISNYRDHLELYNKIDIALDTFPYNGTTTTFEALWMGVPVITKKGNSHVSSVGASILTNIGLQNFIAKDSNQYIDLAKKNSTDIDYLKVLRLSLREKLKKSSLCDGVTFAKDVENAYKSIYEDYFRKQKY